MTDSNSYHRLTAQFLAKIAENMPDMSEEALRRLISNPSQLMTFLMKVQELLPQLSAKRIDYFLKNPDTLASKLQHLQPKPLHKFLQDDRFELFRIQVGCDVVLLRSKAFPHVAVLISDEAMKNSGGRALVISQGYEQEIYYLPCGCCDSSWVVSDHQADDVMMNILKKARELAIQKILMKSPRSAFSLSDCDSGDDMFVDLRNKDAVSTLRVELSPFDIIIKRSDDNSPFTSFCGTD